VTGADEAVAGVALHVNTTAYVYEQLSYTKQHRTVLIIFPPNLQTVIIAPMLPIGEERVN